LDFSTALTANDSAIYGDRNESRDVVVSTALTANDSAMIMCICCCTCAESFNSLNG